MSREFRCAACGLLLTSKLKAIRHLGKVVTVIEPHECGEMVEDLLKGAETGKIVSNKSNIQEVEKDLNSFPFLQKLDKVTSEVEIPHFADKRDKKHLREEMESTAPPGLREMALGRTPGPAENLDNMIESENKREFEDSEMGG